ncbi:MAG TPA: gfo/Idh/MocA family oxidoreductase [Bacteroidetes bacterium]|nr:gfo/Idh/MocA family oxidoreductase [Saprospirales bacterium]HCA43474.1 gfo/Idh/MocA family oxidoreductase [Bacteroidota bacterium]
MEKLKFALIGCGRIGSRHAIHISNYGVLKAVCDIDVQKAIDVGQKCNASIYNDIDSLFENEHDMDVVSICTPNGLHAEHSIKALKNGFHVLCEKPMSINVHDCGRMIHEAERANKRLFIVKQNRFNPPVQVVKGLIDEGKLGRIYSVQLNCFWNRNKNYYNESNWKGTKDLDGGTLFTQFSHFIDLLYYMIGDIKETFSFTDNFHHQNQIEFEDTGVVAIKFYNGVIGTINYTVNSFQKNMEGSLTIFSEKGTVKIGGQYLNELEYARIEDYEISELPQGNPPNLYGDYVGSMSNHAQVYENLMDVLTGNGIIATNGYEGLKTIEIIDKIYANVKNAK